MQLREIVEVSAQAYETIPVENRVAIYRPLRKLGEDDYDVGEIYGYAPESSEQLMSFFAAMHVKEHPDGLLVAMDGWSYPRKVAEALGKVTSEEREAFMAMLGAPSAHPQRTTVATHYAITIDGGEVFATQYRGGELEFPDSTLNVGGRIADFLRKLVDAAR